MAKTNDSIAYCDPRKIIPIIPCRYVVSDEILLTNLDDLPEALQAPTGIGNAPHHQIASIRQGYIYIHGHLSFDGEDCTDKKSHWLIFRYQTRADDCNSDNEPTACASQFQYYQYTWKDGTAESEWVAHQMTSEPYAYVNMAATDTYIAYSEERWPAYMFEEIERNPGWRDKVMQPLTLHEEDGTDPHVMKLDNLQTLVEDYKDIAPEEREANVLRHTAIGKLDISPFEQMKHSGNEHIRERYEYARIVAIQDTLGEAKDLLRLLEIEEANIQNYESEYHYALTTARSIAAVEGLEESIHQRYVDPEWGFSNKMGHLVRSITRTDPFNRSADAQRHALAAYGIAQRQRTQRLADYWSALDQRPGVHEVEKLALQGAEQKHCEDCLGFAASQLSAYVDGVRLNSLTPASVYAKLSLGDDGADDESEWSKLLAALVAVASENVSQLGDSTVIERIHKIFYHVYTEVATTLSRGQSQIRLTYMEKLIGVVQRKTRIATRDMNSQIHQYYEKFLTGRSYTFIDSAGNVHHRYSSIYVTHYDYVTDTPVGRTSAGLSGIAMALAVFSAQQTLKDWHSQHRFDARSQAGAIANLPAVQLSVAFSTVIASYSSLRAEATFIRATQGAGQLAHRFASYAISGLPASTYTLPERPRVGISNAKMAARARLASVVSGIALVPALLLSVAQGVEGYKREDYALLTGHALQGTGSLLMASSLVGGLLKASTSTALMLIGKAVATVALPLAIIGGVLLAAGILFTVARRTELEQWISEGFWGSSKRYWGNDREAQFNDQLEDSKTLPVSIEIQVFFNQEMRAFEKLVWPITAIQIEDSLVVKVEFEGLMDEDDIAQLNIRILGHISGSRGKRWRHIRPQVRREWGGPGLAFIDLSAHDGQGIPMRLEVSFKRLLPDGEYQEFTMLEPLEIKIL